MKRHFPVVLHGVPVDGLDALHVLVQNIFILPLLLLLVLLYEGDAPAVFGLEELGVLVGVKELALLPSVKLLLQHAVVAVRNGLFEHLALLGVVAQVGLPELLHETPVVDFVDDARMLHQVHLGLLFQLLQEEPVAEAVALVEEQVKFGDLHQVQA